MNNYLLSHLELRKYSAIANNINISYIYIIWLMNRTNYQTTHNDIWLHLVIIQSKWWFLGIQNDSLLYFVIISTGTQPFFLLLDLSTTVVINYKKRSNCYEGKMHISWNEGRMWAYSRRAEDFMILSIDFIIFNKITLLNVFIHI